MQVWAFGVMLWELVAEKRAYYWLMPGESALICTGTARRRRTVHTWWPRTRMRVSTVCLYANSMPTRPAAQIMCGVAFNGLRPTWPREVWPELCDIGERCLSTEPAARPGFAQLEEELVALEEAMRVSGGAGEGGGRGGRPVGGTVGGGGGVARRHDWLGKGERC